jgi:hypothetical protein
VEFPEAGNVVLDGMMQVYVLLLGSETPAGKELPLDDQLGIRRGGPLA